MALANVAWILAANRKRVLVIDWDLEAPGLHRYLHPFLHDPALTASDGVIDFVLDFAVAAVATKRGARKDWYKARANMLRYATSLDWKFEKGTLDFIPAGRLGPDYGTRVNSFDWQDFYERLDGGLFLEAAKQSFAGYHYVLIDSRTGVSDTSGICTVQMPDILVVCFTLNTQSIEGAASVAESADAQRRNAQGKRTLRIFPSRCASSAPSRTAWSSGAARLTSGSRPCSGISTRRRRRRIGSASTSVTGRSTRTRKYSRRSPTLRVRPARCSPRSRR
jgi:hypothetical protein